MKNRIDTEDNQDAIENFRGIFPAKGIANYVLDWSQDNGIKRTNLDVQKLVYFCHVLYLVETRQALVRESFEAWKYGPVIPALYRALKNNEDRCITSRLTSLSAKTGLQEEVSLEFLPHDEDILNRSMRIYGALSTFDLVDISHEMGGPWFSRYQSDEQSQSGLRILNKKILEFYSLRKCLSH